MTCIFCENRDIQSRIIFKDRLAWCFLTNIPIVPGHVLICPVRHLETTEELTDEEWRAIKVLIEKVKLALKKSFGAEGFNLAWNQGKLAGQSVKHLHFHIVPRKTGDSGIIEYEPRKFLYRPGSRNVTPEEELSEVARIIKDNINGK